MDAGLRGEVRFPGEEVDICGRWDADSDCFRALVSHGINSIPITWKHKFCHTSVQAVCYCIIQLSDFDSSVLVDHCGLFTQRCAACGLKMQLTPLHATLITAFNLAQNGMEKEDLFGMVALILCLISLGADTSTKVDFDLKQFFEFSSESEDTELSYQHIELNASELAESPFIVALTAGLRRFKSVGN